MSDKKMVSRSVAIGLGIVSAILVASLVGVFAVYMRVVNYKDNTIAGKESQIATLNSTVTSLQDQANNLTDILNLQKSTVWVEGETVSIMTSAPACEENAEFAGYVSVEASSGCNVTVEVRYFSHAVNYENSIILGHSGTAVFPVLPSNISVYIFQTLSEEFVLSDVYATVTITYHY